MAKPEPLHCIVWHRGRRVHEFDLEAKADDLKLFRQQLVDFLKSQKWDPKLWNTFELEVRDRDRRKMATVRAGEGDA